MNDIDKIEIAKIAAQLTIAILDKRTGDITKIVASTRKEGSFDANTPDVFAIFDASYKHIQSTLTEQ